MGSPPSGPLPDELLEEILLRLRPADPASLVRAAAVSQRWRRLVADPVFRRAYRARHGAASMMLGFLCDPMDPYSYFYARFVPTSSFRPRRADHRGMRPEDARHGRVLLRAWPRLCGLAVPRFGLAVWDPVTDHHVKLPRPKRFCRTWNWRATLLCGCAAGACDGLLNCRRGPFTVVVVADSYDSRVGGMLSCVYSSETGSWSKTIFARHLQLQDCQLNRKHGGIAHVGNALYCMLTRGNRILRYDLGTQEFSVMNPPPLLSRQEFQCSEEIELTTTEDGRLGLAVLRKSTLYILSRDREFGWGRPKIIDLEKNGLSVKSEQLIGFVGDVGLAFFQSFRDGIFSIDVKSHQVKKVSEINSGISRAIPYMNFCTPAMGLPSKDDRPRVDASSHVRSCVASSLLTQGEIVQEQF